MTKEELALKIEEKKKELKAFEEEYNKPEITPEQYLLDFIDTLEIKYKRNSFPQSLFLMKDGKIYFELDFKNKYLFYSWKYVFNVFESKFGYNVQQMNVLLTSILEEHFKIGSLTPVLRVFVSDVIGRTF